MQEIEKSSLVMLNSSFLGQASAAVNNETISAPATPQHDVTHMLWLIVPPVLLVLGCYGNVMTIVVMRAMRASESTGCLSVYFTALAVSDLVLLSTLVIWYWSQMAFNTFLAHLHDLSCTSLLFVSYVSSMTSAWLLVAMTCQRMTSVVLPHRVGVLCTVRRAKVVTVIIVSISCVANLHFFFHYHVEYLDGGDQSCLSDDKNVVNIFGFLDLGLASVIPFLFLIVANCVLVYGVMQSVKMSGKMLGPGDTRESSRLAKVSSMTTTLIATSVAFLILTLPTCVLNVYLEMVGYYDGEIEDERWYEELVLADTVCVLMWMGNSAINFYIYILSGRKFREEAKHFLCLCFKYPQMKSRPM